MSDFTQHKYEPMSAEDFDREAGELQLSELKKFTRSRRNESQALNFASKDEIRKAIITGDEVARVMFDRRLPIARQLGKYYKGLRALREAADVLGSGAVHLLKEGLDFYDRRSSESVEDTPPMAITTKPHPKDSLEELLKQRLGLEAPVIDESMVRKIAEEAASAKAEEVAKAHVAPTIQITIPGKSETVKIDGAHRCFKEALRIASIHGRVLLHGPKGTGKSTIAKSIAKAMQYGPNYRLVSCTGESSIYDMLGSRDAEGNYHDGPVLSAFEGGMLLFLDEFDALDPSTGVALNAVLDDGGDASVPQRSERPMAFRHDRFLPILAVNTMEGATSSYVGRMKQDGATMSRFPELVRVFVDYDRKIEAGILSDAVDLAKKMWDLRKKVQKLSLSDSRVITTRDFVAAAREVKARKAGFDGALSDIAIFDRLTAGWTKEERAKVSC
jgi:predicted ATPase with chaperone activity